MAKKLVVCCDGTWDSPGDATPTNVEKIQRAIAPQTDDGVVQITRYFKGVGANRWDHLRGGAFGVGLSDNVRKAYTFLVQNYAPGDELYLFGFSRGAFTVRSLAGLIRNSGILLLGNDSRIDKAQMKEAWSLYRDASKQPNGEASKKFRAKNSHPETKTRFIGVWDTVGSLGIPALGPALLGKLINRRWEFHNTTLSSQVDGAFQALAIDEHRRQFAPALWQQQPAAAKRGQVLKQVWFPGVHRDVGGGNVGTGLSDLALLWMMSQACEFGLKFEGDAIGGTGFGPNYLGTSDDTRTGVYRLSDPIDRAIGQVENGEEYLADTAIARVRDYPNYNPRNLANANLDRHETVPQNLTAVPGECVSGVTFPRAA